MPLGHRLLLRLIHRHTGGLESKTQGKQAKPKIHRHTGGLESQYEIKPRHQYIHRHTGGLEISLLAV